MKLCEVMRGEEMLLGLAVSRQRRIISSQAKSGSRCREHKRKEAAICRSDWESRSLQIVYKTVAFSLIRDLFRSLSLSGLSICRVIIAAGYGCTPWCCGA